MNEGAEKYQRGDYPGALAAFQGADDIMGVPTTGLELAKAQAKLGLLVEALEKLARVRNYPVTAGEPAPYAQAREQAEALVIEVTARIPSLEIAIVELPAGTSAEVTIDGTALPPAMAKLPQKLNPGPHRVSVKAAGFAAYEQEVTLQEQEHRRLEVELQPGAAGAPAEPPAPAAAPAAPRPPPPAMAPEQAEEPAAVPPLAWVAFGVGAAGLVAGTVAGAMALSQISTLQDECPDKQCEPGKDADIDRTTTTAHVATAGFVVAGVGAAVGLILVLTADSGAAEPDPEESTAGAVIVEPVLGLGTAGLVGRF